MLVCGRPCVVSYNPELSARENAAIIARSVEPGVSFSIKTCLDFGIDWRSCLNSLIDLGIKRFRIMSYWDVHEPASGEIDFRLLDEQLAILAKRRCRVTLCIGMRQPRWPESHVPSWALLLPEEERLNHYLLYHQLVVERYKDNPCIESWQLENEFWNRGFGVNHNFSRFRLKTEFAVIRALDPRRPIIMSLANTYGLPLFAPKPDLFGTTLYVIQHKDDAYTPTKLTPFYFRMRRFLVRLFGRRDLVVHELQAEPWGPAATQNLSDDEQAKSMNSAQLTRVISFARRSGIRYMDLWGGEWWYWRKTTRRDHELWAAIKNEVHEARHTS